MRKEKFYTLKVVYMLNGVEQVAKYGMTHAEFEKFFDHCVKPIGAVVVSVTNIHEPMRYVR